MKIEIIIDGHIYHEKPTPKGTQINITNDSGLQMIKAGIAKEIKEEVIIPFDGTPKLKKEKVKNGDTN